ncbi:MAG TPA: hypothetical protein VLF91_03400 [Candidatus Saccharimonadales bacterium]|nr:hypothetical protein [Candidatus Saccharimonadales bacterium]
MKTLKRTLLALFSVLALTASAALPTGIASASGCKLYTNPGQSSFNANWYDSLDGVWYPMGFSGTLYTGDSSSSCSDINISNLAGNSEVCWGGVAVVAVQYLSNGVWHTDTGDNGSGITDVPCNSSSLKVIGANYANNTPFRVLIDVWDINGQQANPWPTFKLYV